jgi:hypothetical protein
MPASRRRGCERQVGSRGERRRAGGPAVDAAGVEVTLPEPVAVTATAKRASPPPPASAPASGPFPDVPASGEPPSGAGGAEDPDPSREPVPQATRSAAAITNASLRNWEPPQTGKRCPLAPGEATSVRLPGRPGLPGAGCRNRRAAGLARSRRTNWPRWCRCDGSAAPTKSRRSPSRDGRDRLRVVGLDGGVHPR